MTIHTNPQSRIGLLDESKTFTLAALLAVVIALLSLAPVRSAEAATPTDTFTVTESTDASDTDPGDGDCDVSSVVGFDCTLRAAIQEANATPEPDLIRFSIIDASGAVKTIKPTSPLPPITEAVTIDGYTQTGASPNTKAVGNDAVLKIELNGVSVPGANGLEIKGTSGGSVIRGLVINRFLEGISIDGDTVGNRIEGNFIGTDPTGTLDRGNTDDGVNVFGGASENVVGGPTPAARNVISGNDINAVFVSEANANKIQGNYMGTDKGGTSGLGNGDVAVSINDSFGNTLGGTTAASRNVISGNRFDGVAIFGSSRENKVLGNRIGTNASGTAPLGNGEAGVTINGIAARDNLVGDGTSGGSNTIAFNGEDGVEVQAGTGNLISHNSTFSNTGIGIDLDADGPTANDAGDADGGPNGLQNKPVLSSAKSSSTKTTITGKLNSRPDSDFVIEFFSNPSGNEGKKFIGQKSVVTDASGNASFAFSPANRVAAGQTITATATTGRIVVGEVSGTSEFSAPRTVALATGSEISPETTSLSGPSGVTRNPTAHFRFSSPDPDATFRCSLDGGSYYGCSSPENINRLSEGGHTFEVRAKDGDGNVDPSPAQ